FGGFDANLSYNQSFTLELEGSFDYEAFGQAVRDLTIRHESLRSTFSNDGESLIIYTDLPVDIIQNETNCSNREEFSKCFTKFTKQGVLPSYNLQDSPLVRCIPHGDCSCTYSTVTVHHIGGDGWSIGVI